MAAAEGSPVDSVQLKVMRGELEDVRGEISSLIRQIEAVREDLHNGQRRSGLASACCCCRRRDLRKLEDRLWLRLHQLQEKENELHRQRTAILSRSLDTRPGYPCSPIARHHPPPVSPEAPESPPPWHQHRQQHHKYQQHQRSPPPDQRRLVPSSTVAEYSHPTSAMPSRIVPEAAGASATVPAQRPAQPPGPRQLIPATRPLSLRRRPCRPGSAEDTGSGAE